MKTLFKTLLDNLTSQELINESKSVEYLELFESKLESHLKSEIEKEIETLDESATEKLKEVVSFLESKHDNEVNAIDKDVCEKLISIKELYESKADDTIAPKLDAFIDAYLDESIPEATILDAFKMETLQSAVDTIKETLCITEAVVKDEFSKALLEAKGTIDEKNEKIKVLSEENLEVQLKLKRQETTELLENKTKLLSPALKTHLETLFETKSVQHIEERFDEAVEAYLEHVADATPKDKSEGLKVIVEDKDENQIITEDANASMMKHYINSVESIGKFHSK